jgi:DNA-binding MarR family transcriptional regulator
VTSHTSTPPPAVPAGLDDVEREITRFLRRARTASQAMAAEVHPDLDAAGYSVLVCVLQLSESMPEGVRAADVGAALNLHKSTTSRNVGELERLGLLERVPDLSDARARLLQLTSSGRASVTRSREGRRSRVAQRLSLWPQHDVCELARLLGRLNDDLSRPTDAAAAPLDA